MTQKDGEITSPPKKSSRQRRVSILAVVLIILLVLAGVLYSQRTLLLSLFAGSHVPASTHSQSPSSLKLPPGFHAQVFASNLSGPRFIAFSPDGTLFVADRGSGSIIALPDPQQTGNAQEHKVIADGLSDPTSLVFHEGYLFVGESSRVSRFKLDGLNKITQAEVVVPHLPTGGNHSTRTVLIGPDNRLYVSIGSTCNVCNESDPQRATVWVYNLDGSNGHLYATGLRNAVGLAINPWNQQIWATNNGRDLLGDDTPPETVYALQQEGDDYGWPRCHAGDLIDPDFGHPGDCNGIVKPQVKMQAHSAPLGLAFYNSDKATAFPAQFHGLFIAFHGSWNRSVPTGYKVVFVPLDNKGHVSGAVQDFATGWLINKDQQSGRPVGLAVGPDGSLYISDDAASLIYRITYTNP